MLSDEEKKAIEKKYNSILNNAKANWIYEDYEILLNFQDLYKQQQKEIEELKDTRSIFNMGRRSYKNEIENKIKEILGIEEDIDNEKLLSLLQTIVDENARLEDIEDKKVQIEYNNVFNKGVKSVEDKIKAKIEEVDYKMIAHQDVREAVKQALQSLLEKE